jgi:hypothetical protein
MLLPQDHADPITASTLQVKSLNSALSCMFLHTSLLQAFDDASARLDSGSMSQSVLLYTHSAWFVLVRRTMRETLFWQSLADSQYIAILLTVTP